MSGIILPHSQQKKGPKAFESYEAHLADVIRRHKASVERIMDAEAIDQSEANHYALQKTMFGLQVQVEQLVAIIGTLTQRKK